MFDPKNQEVDCPDCGRREVYFDREIGFYCMACGRQLSPEEEALLVEYELLHAQSEDQT